MGNFISNFDTTAELATFSATTDFGRPHVSLTKDNSKVHFFDDPYKGHEYVEIGGLKWATMNIGATSVTDYGLYFQWGDTQGYTASQVGSGEGQKYFGWADYKYGGNDEGGQTKYNYTDELITLQTSDDAVTAAWGGNWRMPTVSEWQTLGESVNSAWTADYQGSGVSGLVLTDKTDSSKVLFFPAAGDCIFGSVNNVGSHGCYWSSSLNADYYEGSAYCIHFGSGSVNWDDYNSRHLGFQVRGVVG